MFKSLTTRLLCIAFVFVYHTDAMSQSPKKWTSVDIQQAIEKLNFLGSALYVAAHPDDENTRMISYLANEVKANTAYLSLTRGDGGQNLIGSEIQELLGVIRTQELMAARRIDGGKQLFSRANDFGYSKHSDETLEIWDRDEVLSDVVWTIRTFRPDIIINRFDHRTPGRTHGHHTASAILSFDAFDITGDRNVYPEQLEYTAPWEARRLFLNTSWWFYGSREAFEKVDKSKMVKVDIGVYYPGFGKSNNEIAAESRSMHVCQGMGSTPRRGSAPEYLELLKGDMPAANDLFEGINTTWTRVKGGAPIKREIDAILANYDYKDPSKSVASLMRVHQLISGIKNEYWKTIKLQEIKDIIAACMGLFLEANSDNSAVVAGDHIELSFEAINRSSASVMLQGVRILPIEKDTILDVSLSNNEGFGFSKKIDISTDARMTSAYWLKEKGSLGMYTVDNQELIGVPETPRDYKVEFDLIVEGLPITFTRDIIYKFTSPEKGEVYKPFEITPELFVSVAKSVYIFPGESPIEVKVKVKAGAGHQKGSVRLPLPDGWRAEPASFDFIIKNKGAEKEFTFEIFPPEGQSLIEVTPEVYASGSKYKDEQVIIDYDHIPQQTIVKEATATFAKIDIKKVGNRIAYIMGAGDDIPTSLEQIGYQVDIIRTEDISLERLETYDALIMGVRAYNKLEELRFKQDVLLDYVEKGGTMIVQYNTHRRLKTDRIAPYPLKISRDRVTVEEAEIRILEPDHLVMNYPNKITSEDFEGWKQERGLYFPNEWDDNFTAILSSNDPGESAKDGGLLIAKYGEGYYIYTGYSWFRQLPLGVPGAFRIFANLISIGKVNRP